MTRARRRTPTGSCSSWTARSSRSWPVPPATASSRSWAGWEADVLRVSLRNLLTGKLRLLLTVAAVTLGVSFVSGTFVLSDTMVKAFNQLYTGLNSGTDVLVRSQSAYTDVTTTGGQVPPMDEDVLATVRDVPGVAAVQGAVSGFALIIDKQGDPMEPGGAPTIGTSIGQDRRLYGDLTFRAGRAPDGPDEVVVDAQTAEKAGF